MSIPYHIHSEDCDCRELRGDFNLISAGQFGDIKRIKFLIEIKRYNPNKEDDYGYTCLHLAAQNNRVSFFFPTSLFFHSLCVRFSLTQPFSFHLVFVTHTCLLEIVLNAVKSIQMSLTIISPQFRLI